MGKQVFSYKNRENGMSHKSHQTNGCTATCDGLTTGVRERQELVG